MNPARVYACTKRLFPRDRAVFLFDFRTKRWENRGMIQSSHTQLRLSGKIKQDKYRKDACAPVQYVYSRATLQALFLIE